MEIGKLLLIIVCSLFIIIIVIDVICRLIAKEQGVYQTELFKVSYVKRLNRYTCELKRTARKRLSNYYSKDIKICVYGNSIDEVLQLAAKELREAIR